ncbi:MAG: FUSC family protein [Deltaproteobacteria bacterium]|nr:FUSC family protein [Deltaproteobacteria bacterium]
MTEFSAPRFARQRIMREAARTLASAVLAYYASLLLSLPEPHWASFAAVIATRGYAGATRHIGAGRVLGALAGAAWAVGATVLAGERIPDGLALALIITPPALLAAWKPLYRSALVTALIVLTAGAHAAWSVAWLRMAALGAGAATAMLVATLLWPRSAPDAAKILANRIRRMLAAALEAARHGEKASYTLETALADLESLRKLAFVSGREKFDQINIDALYTAAVNAACSVSVVSRLERARREATAAGTGVGNAAESLADSEHGPGLPNLVRRDMRNLERALQGEQA